MNNMNKITPEEIKQEVDTLAQKKVHKDSQHIFESLLEQIHRVNFKTEVYPKEMGSLLKRKKNAAGDEVLAKIQKEIEELKLFQKHYLIITIEKLLEIARSNKWDLCKRFSYFYLYNGTHWTVLDQKELVMFLGKAARKMGVSKYDSKYYDFKEKLFKQFESESLLPQPKVKENTVLINLKNGTFEITPEGQVLRDFKPEDFLTYQMGFQYDPNACAPRFHQYLNEVLPDQESQQVLAEFMGYIFTRNLKLEKVLFLYGTGRNGKSVLFDIIRAMIGENNISYYGLSSLTDDLGYHRAKLVNKLVNWASDVGDRLQSNIFKQLASGEPTECRLPYKDPFELHNVCKFVFNSNSLPSDVEQSDAFFERFLIIPFTQYIEPEKRDSNLAKKIISEELPGVFNWVLDGLNRLVKQEKFSPCKASDDILQKFRRESDSVAMFIYEMNYEPVAGEWIQFKPVYTEYWNYCIDEGVKPEPKKKFNERLENLGFFTAKKNVGKVIYMREITTNGTH